MKYERVMKLTIELVPESVWYSNLRNNISKENWDIIRKKAYADAKHRCKICGAESKLNCHEIWHYDDKNHIQTLKGFIALCTDCHMIKHIGLAEILASEGKLDMEALIDHFLTVNNVDIVTFNKHNQLAFMLWAKRSKYKWKTDLGEWDSLVSR